MKKKSIFLLFTGTVALAVFFLFFLYSSSGSHHAVKTGKEHAKMSKPALLAMQAGYQLMKLRDPKTGLMPSGIRARELDFASRLPAHPEGVGQDWNWRGPANMGGRMLCISIDVDNENHWLAGSASGGMWESNNKGLSWHKTTSPDAEQSATCLVQDKRPGKHKLSLQVGELPAGVYSLVLSDGKGVIVKKLVKVAQM